MQSRRLTAVIVVVFASVHVTHADDAVWRSSRPLRVVSMVGATDTSAAERARFVWERIEYPLIIQQLQSEVEEARDDTEFWELRLMNYERLRFTDAVQTAIKHTENALAASRRRERDVRRKLHLVRLNRVLLGQQRALLTDPQSVSRLPVQ